MDSIEDIKRALDIQRKARAQAELQLEQKSRELYEKNQSLHAALRRVNEQQRTIIAQEKYASIGQLSAGLAHEINNPNAYVLSNLGSLQEYINNLTAGAKRIQELIHKTDSLPPSLIQAVDNLYEEYDFEFIYEDIQALIKETEIGAQRIKRITQGMQYFSNQDPKQILPFDMTVCLEKSIALIQNEEGIGVSFDVEIDSIPEFSGVLPLVSQALVNILRNAAQANPKSGRVKVKAKVINNELVIFIFDDGEGIRDENISRVFDPFYTTKDHVNGLGLTISQAIIKQHNGSIDVASEFGKYTEFRVHLPLS